MRIAILITLALLSAGTTAAGQVIPPRPKVELRPHVGGLIPAGDHREHVQSAPMYGIQAAIELSPALHILGSLDWSPGHLELDAGDSGLDVFQYDIGMEYNIRVPLAGRWELKPFAGAGFGARTYRYDDDELDGNMPLTAHAALGTELQRGLYAIRLESRGYLFQCTNPVTDVTNPGNDVGVTLGFAYHIPRRR